MAIEKTLDETEARTPTNGPIGSLAIGPGEATPAEPWALIILNPVSGVGSAEGVRRTIEAAFDAAGRPYQVYATTGDDDFRALVQNAIAAGAEIVVAGGGDGTVADVGDSLVGTAASLGIIPLGTGNVLAQALGIPFDPVLAAQLIAGPHHLCELDAMRVGNRHFLLQIGVGLDSLMIRNTDRQAKRRFGRFAYLITLAKLLIGYQAKRYLLKIDGQSRRLKAWDILVANAGTLGTADLHWSPNIRPTDGQLDVIVVNVQHFTDYLRVAWRILLGLKRRGPTVTIYPVRREVTVAANRNLPVQADGEIIGRTPLTVDVVPHALKVIVPVECQIEKAGDEALATLGREKAVRRQGRLRRWLGPIGVVDTSAALMVNALPHPPILNIFMEAIATVMQRGDGWLIWLAAALNAEHRTWRAAIDVAPPLWLTDIAVEGVLKRIFRRPRPFLATVLAPVIGRKPGSHSFPSGHAASAFAGAWLLSRQFPKATKGLYAFATLVAFSRLYLGVHYFSDVVAGAISGIGFAALFNLLTGVALGSIAKKLGR